AFCKAEPLEALPPPEEPAFERAAGREVVLLRELEVVGLLLLVTAKYLVRRQDHPPPFTFTPLLRTGPRWTRCDRPTPGGPGARPAPARRSPLASRARPRRPEAPSTALPSRTPARCRSRPARRGP